jgi:hypothetical protein
MLLVWTQTKIKQVSKNKKKWQIIQTLTLKQKVKHHYTKRGDGIFDVDKEQNDYSFSFFVNKFLTFYISKMSTKENFVEKLQKQSRKRL